MTNFRILKKDKNSKARLGLLTTPHGTVKTPSYVMVGTYGQIRNLSSLDIKKTKTQMIIANTFHLWKSALKNKNRDKRLLTRFGIIPTMTDSGGFQVLSLAFGDKIKVGKFMIGDAKTDKDYKRSRIRITENGVYFKKPNDIASRLVWEFLGPELSIKLQGKIGADIIFAFDHITSPLDDHKYNKKAVELTDKWAQICLKEHAKNQKNRINKQGLFGIVQGGLFKDLRIQSAKSIGAMPFDGFGIGGSYTKKQISKVLKWITPHLPEEKPRHLLGVGKIEDIFEAVSSGIDTFDCVIPTREARHGRLYTKTGNIDIRRGYFSKDKKVIEKGCGCQTCKAKMPRHEIRKLIKSHNRILNNSGQRYCLMHNMWFFNNLLQDIRSSIAKDKFRELKNKFLNNRK